jgi:hypothetical protein
MGLTPEEQARMEQLQAEISQFEAPTPTIAPSTEGRTWNRYADNLAQQAIGGLTLGYDDEIFGGIAGLANYVTGKGATGEQMLDKYRAEDKAFQQSDPAAAILAGIGGSMMMPGGSVLGLATKATMGVNAAKALNSGIVGRVAQAVTDGAIAGSGEAEGDFAKRMIGGLASGAISGGIGGGASAITSGGGALYNKVGQALGDGAFDPTIRKIGDTLGLDAVTAPILKEAQDRINLAAQYNIPLNVLDSVTVPVTSGGDTAKSSLYNLAKQVAQTLDGGIMESQVALKQRGENRFDRINSILDQIAPGKGVRAASEDFSSMAEDAVKTARKSLAQEEGQLFRDMKEQFPKIGAERANKLLEIETPDGIAPVKSLLDSAYKTHKIVAMEQGAPAMSKADFERSTEGWLSVRKEVSDRLEGLKQSNDSSKYSEMRPVASLLKVIDSEINAATEGGLKKANKAYADRYAAEPEVLDIGGIIQRIAKDRSLGASPIARIKEVYGATAIDSADIEAVSRYLPDDANRLGLRAGLGVSYNDKGDNPARALLKSDRIKNQMQRILPEQEVAQIRQLLNFENAINTNTQGLTQGSPTNSNQYSTIKEVLKKVPGVSLLSRLADDMQSRKTTDEYSKLANAMFRTGGEGSAVLDDVIRYMERADKIRPVDDTWRNFYLSSGRTMAPRILDVILGK